MYLMHCTQVQWHFRLVRLASTILAGPKPTRVHGEDPYSQGMQQKQFCTLAFVSSTYSAVPVIVRLRLAYISLYCDAEAVAVLYLCQIFWQVMRYPAVTPGKLLAQWYMHPTFCYTLSESNIHTAPDQNNHKSSFRTTIKVANMEWQHERIRNFMHARNSTTLGWIDHTTGTCLEPFHLWRFLRLQDRAAQLWSQRKLVKVERNGA